MPETDKTKSARQAIKATMLRHLYKCKSELLLVSLFVCSIQKIIISVSVYRRFEQGYNGKKKGKIADIRIIAVNSNDM